MAQVFGFLLFSIVSLGSPEGAPALTQNLTHLDWWETTLLYQLYPRSFKDSDGDGMGDFNGIIEKLDYIKDLGVDAIWIQPFYKSPMFDMGYDVSDYNAVDPIFGTMDDFKRMQKAIKDKGIKLILDYVPNHTSDQCDWFKLSEQRVDPYTDYYIWRDAKRINDTHTTVPNNWVSIFKGTAWKWSEKRKQYFFHQFSTQQPDLNFRNHKVKKEMEEVLRFWLDLGVDGFRVDSVPLLYEAEHFMDEPPGDGYKYRIYTLDQPENVGLIKEWRAVVDEYSKKDGHQRFLAVESYANPTKTVKYIGNETHPGSQIPFYFYMTFLKNEHNSTIVEKFVRWETTVFPRKSYNWVLDNHDNSRTRTRLSDESVDVWNMFILLLPGLASVYYGTELGMEDLQLRKDQLQDTLNGGFGRSDTRDSYRGPMIWDDTQNAGFTASKYPWLPVQPSYWRWNVKAQQQDPNSHLNIFKRLATLRKSPTITHGDFETHLISTWVYMYTRSLEDETIAVLINIGSETEDVCVKHVGCAVPSPMFVHTRSANSKVNIGDPVFSNEKSSRCIRMRPHSGIVLSTSKAVSASCSTFILLLALLSKFTL